MVESPAMLNTKNNLHFLLLVRLSLWWLYSDANYTVDKDKINSKYCIDVDWSAFALRRLNKYLIRCSQTEERLGALAFIHINYETIVEIDYVCKLCFKKHPRRLEGASLIFN